MGAPRSKWISISEAEIGKKYRGYKTANNPGAMHLASIVYQGDGKGIVFDKYPEDNLTELSVETTWEEREQWYRDQFDLTNSKNQLNLLGLFNDMYDVGDAYHEMWNGWIGADFYEMNADLVENDHFLVGIAPAPFGCAVIDDSVAFVAEQNDGTRFWCHGGRRWVEDMRKQMQSVYDTYMSKK